MRLITALTITAGNRPGGTEYVSPGRKPWVDGTRLSPGGAAETNLDRT